MESKGLTRDTAEKVGEYIRVCGDRDLLGQLAEGPLGATSGGAKALQELNLLADYSHLVQILPRLSFDLSLARGLDYYTGIIYEAILVGKYPFYL